MRKHLKLATLSVAVGAALSAAYLMGYLPTQIGEPTADIAQVTPDTPVMAQTTQPQASGEEPPHQGPAIDPEDVDPASIDWAAMKARYDFMGLDPMLLREMPFSHQPPYSAQEIAAFDQLHVLPFNTTVGWDCYPKVFEPGERSNDYEIKETCKPVGQHQDHPYELLELTELKERAVTDAAAAIFASRKSEDPTEMIGYAVHAAALSEKSGPILELAEREFGLPTGFDKDNNPILSDYYIVNRAVLLRIAQAMADPRVDLRQSNSDVEALGETPKRTKELFDRIEATTQDLLESMSEIQRDVTGSTQIWEATNA